MPKWASPDEVLQIINQTLNDEWHEKGAIILDTLVEEWRKKKKSPEVSPSKFGKRLFFKATRVGPRFSGPIKDTLDRRNCFSDGKRVPCQRFGGQGEGWSTLRTQEDLYDALRRLVDEIKLNKHTGWHELIGLLAHTPVEDLKRLKQEHSLSAPSQLKQQLTQRLQEELAHVGHQIQPQQQMKSYRKKNEELTHPKTPETPPIEPLKESESPEVEQIKQPISPPRKEVESNRPPQEPKIHQEPEKKESAPLGRPGTPEWVSSKLEEFDPLRYESAEEFIQAVRTELRSMGYGYVLANPGMLQNIIDAVNSTWKETTDKNTASYNLFSKRREERGSRWRLSPIEPFKSMGDRIRSYTFGDQLVKEFHQFDADFSSNLQEIQVRLSRAIETVTAYRKSLSNNIDPLKDSRYLELDNAAADAEIEFENMLDNKQEKEHALLFEKMGRDKKWAYIIDPRVRQIGPFGADIVKDVEYAMGFIGKIMSYSDDGPPKEQVVIFYPLDPDGKTSNRSHFKHWNNGIYMEDLSSGWEQKSMIIHEIGHYLENTVEGVRIAAQDFLEYRRNNSKNEDSKKIYKLRELFPERRYKDHEEGFGDEFEKAFGRDAHYVGKIYGSGDTELISMGLQKLWESPSWFALKDPEYFSFIIGICTGALRNFPYPHYLREKS